jgi:hypothetical protein
MAHFAKLNENNEVIDVIVVDNNVLLDVNGVEQELLGFNFLVEWSNGHTFWKQTSYNANFRKNYAHIGGIYDPVRDAFISPKPEFCDSWTLNEETCRWEPPVPYPNDGKIYRWNEGVENWQEID